MTSQHAPLSAPGTTSTEHPTTPTTSAAATPALLLLSFGGPNKSEDVVPFLENVTRGRGIPRERLAQVGEHYFALGGASPINAQNLQLIGNIEAELAARGVELPVYFGNRNWEPFVEDVTVRMAQDGITHAYVFVTSAWGGYSGCAQYQEDIQRAVAACEAAGLSAPVMKRLPHFHNHPAFIAQFAADVDAARAALPAEAQETADLVFTAHSVPTAADTQAGPHAFGGSLYSQQVLDTARLVQQASSFASQPGSGAGYGWTGQLALHQPVGGRGDGPASTGETVGVDVGVGTEYDVELVWQSRSGSAHTPWLEPDICDHIEARAQRGNTRAIVLCPVGFITDHIEVMWDLDTEARAVAQEAGISFVRSATPGLSPRFAAMVVDLIADSAARNRVMPRIPGLEVSEFSGAQVAAKALADRLSTVPNLGATVNGQFCAPGCCGSQH